MDSFLLAHRITESIFDIGCGFSPISIRDQIIRGFLIADRLHRANLIAHTKPLLVIGAGAAGATAALIAAERGIPTTLIDRLPHPFSRQLGSTRVISPTLYDWPADHWTVEHFPWKGIMLPLEWREGEAGPVSAIWTQKLYEMEQRFPNLRVLMGYEVKAAEKLKEFKVKKNRGLVNVTIKDVNNRESPQSANFSVILGCTGPGEERCYADPAGYKGVAFWEPDSLDYPDFGLTEIAKPRIVLSGGGDGILQDFIRIITTCTSAREVLSVLPPDARESLAKAVRTAEEQFLRSFVWNIGLYDCRTSHNLQKCYEAIISNMLQDTTSSGYKPLREGLSSVIRPNLKQIDFRLVHPCDHFSSCYGLNRALVLLIAAFIEETLGIRLITPFSGITRVWSDQHNCASEREVCASSEHKVEFGVARCEHVRTDPPTPISLPQSHTFDLVILRHGVTPKNLFGERPTSNPRQVLPYYLDLDWY